MKKTKLTRSLLAAVSIVALSAVMYGCVHDGDDPPATDDTSMETPDPAAPVDVTMDVALNAEQQKRLLEVLPDSGTSDTIMIPAGGTATRGDGLGVEFSCDSAYPCTVTVTNSLGTILASVTTQMLPDADEPMVTAGLPDPVNTFENLNLGDVDSIRVDVVGAGADSSAANPNITATELIGMGVGGPGVLNADMAGLRSDFQANGGDFTDAAGAVLSPQPTAGAAPGAAPTLMGGTTITGAMDGIDASEDMMRARDDMGLAPDDAPPGGWVMKTLFRDWGDTAGDGDGGYETAAIVVKNLGDGTPYPFNSKLAAKYVIPAAQSMFRLSVRADGTGATVTSLATSVDIDSAASPTNTQALMATPTQWGAMVFDAGSLVTAQSQDPNVNEDETFKGSYFGAPGQFQCVSDGSTAALSCGIARNADGAIMVIDGDPAADGIQGNGRWTFTPDPDAMIKVPDQDWMAYGAWLTTPDNRAGGAEAHRLGVFFNGMDVWAPAPNALTADNAAGLRGSATYSGGATGVYVDGSASGLFTARAMLTAHFDRDSTGANVEGTDYRISGRIDNFRGTDGVYLGDDTQASPNDPTAGENDWVVELGAADFDTSGSEGTIAATGTTGSADGVSWTGLWNGQMFGPSADADGDAIAPSGVAGRFWAETADPDAADDAMNPVTAVVGAFGATRDE